MFAGSGISTENRLVFPQTMYEDVCEKLGLDTATAPPFPDLMTRYCARPNGRARLLQRIEKRFRYVRSYPELYAQATRFHSELSTLYHVENIITTNWDDFFERECGATPFVTAQDFALWKVPGRRVFKLHGSVSNYGSVVATRSDYEACLDRLSTGLLGSSLKMMLATKTLLYVGFSFTDDDFLRLHDLLSKEMGGLRPQSYIVTLDDAADSRLRAHGLTPIYTDGAFFLHRLKAELVNRTCMLADARFDAVYECLDLLKSLHAAMGNSIDSRRHPEVLYCLSYQDGLIHAFERIIELRKTGHYSHQCNVGETVLSYEKSRRTALAARCYLDVAYIDGFINGHCFLIYPDEMRAAVPLYYVFGHTGALRSLAAYRRVARDSSKIHRAAYCHASKRVQAAAPGRYFFHHLPFLRHD